MAPAQPNTSVRLPAFATRWVLLLVAANAITACGDSENVPRIVVNGTGGQGGEQIDAGSTGGTSSLPNPCVQPSSDLTSRDADELFGSTQVPTFDLYLPAQDWENLKVNARDEQYVPAQACFQGEAVGLVGLRFKGSYGSLYSCFDASGKNTCRKLGMKIKFDEYVPSQRLFGLKRLNFQGYRWDDSYLKEHLSYELYRSMGIVAPRSSWAQLRVNGELQGVYGMVEQIDGRFTKDRWPDNGDGNLFKEIWPGQTNPDWIRTHLETNEDIADVSGMLTFSNALNSATPDTLRATLGSFSDLDYFTRYMVVDDAIANFDGVTTYYTNGSPDEAGNHNFYLYQESADKFTIIPWDLESTLSLASNFGNVPYWQTKPAACSDVFPVWGGQNEVIAPGCDRVFAALATDVTAYRTHAQELLAGAFAEQQMLANVDSAAALIRDAASQDPHGPGPTAFENAVGFIKQEIPKLRRRLEHFVSGEMSNPLVFQPSRVADFEAADDYGITDGTGQMSNGHTTSSVQLNMTDPVSGSKTLRIQFSFGNEQEPWQQWMWFRVPMSPSPADLTKFSGIRLKMRSNQTRDVWLALISPHNSKTSEGIDLGWTLAATTTAKEFTVNFADAAVPFWATDPGDDHNLILQTVTNLSFQPICEGCKTGPVLGQLPEGVSEVGWVDVDDLSFF